MKRKLCQHSGFISVWTKISITLFTAVFLIVSCSMGKSVIKTAKNKTPVKIADPILAKRIDDKGTKGIPRKITDDFSVLDTEVVSSIRLMDLTGTHMMRWDWYQPDGSLYYSTGDTLLDIAPGKYREETTVWHKIPIYGDKASELPGKWTVKLFFDDNVVTSDVFYIHDIDVDTLPKFSQKSDPKKWGIVIGIENYASLPDVTYAGKDATLFSNYLRKIIGVPEENMITITNAEATKGVIEGYLKSYLPSNIENNATLYVYFAGHGTPNVNDGDAYIIPYDGNPKFIEHTGYKLKTLYNDIDALKIAKAIVFIDSCFSGAQARSDKMFMNLRPALIHVKDVDVPSEKVISLSASTSKQVSNVYAEKKHGLFSYFLLKGMRGAADFNGNNAITIQELYNYTKINVDSVSKRIGMNQTPVILPSFDAVENVNVSMVLK